MTGYAMALNLLASVLQARSTGEGRDVDVCLYDVGLANLNYLAAWTLNADYQPGRIARSAHPSLVPCQLFATADGWIYIMANKEKFFPLLCERLGVPGLARDARFATFADRLENRDTLSGLLDTAFRRQPTAQWLEVLAGAVPAAPVRTVAEALSSDFTAERGLVIRAEAATGASVALVGSPFGVCEPADTAAAPALGQSSTEILLRAGYGMDEIERLRALGILS